MTDDETIAHWIELSRKYPKVDGGPGVLPITKIGEAYYFIDVRMKQLRNVVDPSKFFGFRTGDDLTMFLKLHGELIA